jgi:hypothetical protein
MNTLKKRITGFEVGDYVHKHLGKVKITEACVYIQKNQGCDPTSIFIDHDGDIKEVSINCVLKG